MASCEFSSEQIQHIENVCKMFDHTGEKKIAINKLESILAECGLQASEIKQILAKLNKYNLNYETLTFDQIIEILNILNKENSNELFRIKDTFDEIDKNNDGYITKEELKELMEYFEEKETDVDKIFENANLNEEGELSLSEYVRILKALY